MGSGGGRVDEGYEEGQRRLKEYFKTIVETGEPTELDDSGEVKEKSPSSHKAQGPRKFSVSIYFIECPLLPMSNPTQYKYTTIKIDPEIGDAFDIWVQQNEAFLRSIKSFNRSGAAAYVLREHLIDYGLLPELHAHSSVPAPTPPEK